MISRCYKGNKVTQRNKMLSSDSVARILLSLQMCYHVCMYVYVCTRVCGVVWRGVVCMCGVVCVVWCVWSGVGGVEWCVCVCVWCVEVCVGGVVCVEWCVWSRWCVWSGVRWGRPVCLMIIVIVMIEIQLTFSSSLGPLEFPAADKPPKPKNKKPLHGCTKMNVPHGPGRLERMVIETHSEHGQLHS